VHVFALALLALVGAPPAADSPQAAALAAFKRKDYARACPLFAEAARAQPENGAVWADLGLCELKRGRKAESVRASLRAVLKGRTRTNAYFNLGQAGVALPFPPPGRCTAWKAPDELGCPQRVEACHVSLQGFGYKGQGRNSFALLGRCGEGCPRPSVPENPTLPLKDVPMLAALDDFTGRSDWPALLLYDDDVQEAFGEIENEDGTTTQIHGTGGTIATDCSVVVLDACRGRAGLFCTRTEELPHGGTRVERAGHEHRFRVP